MGPNIFTETVQGHYESYGEDVEKTVQHDDSPSPSTFGVIVLFECRQMDYLIGQAGITNMAVG